MPFFKKKKEEQKEEQREIKETEKKKTKLGLPEGKDPALYKLIEKPLITEKATGLAGFNQYVFRVWQKTNKIEVRKAIEKLYDVKVKEVKIINAVGKKRQIGRFEGWKPGYKKAIVILEKEQTIANV